MYFKEEEKEIGNFENEKKIQFKLSLRNVKRKIEIRAGNDREPCHGIEG